MSSFYGGKPGRDYSLASFTSLADLNADAENLNSSIPIDGYAILLVEENYALYQKCYDSSLGKSVYQLIASLTGPQGQPGSPGQDGPKGEDGPPGPTSGVASEVSYDNTESELEATDVQSAIDELAVNFQDGCDSITQAVIAKGGETPANNTPQGIVEAVSTINQPGFIIPLAFDYDKGYLEEVYDEDLQEYIYVWTADPNTTTDYLCDIYPITQGRIYRLQMGSQSYYFWRLTYALTSDYPIPVDQNPVNITSMTGLDDGDSWGLKTYYLYPEEDGYLIIQKNYDDYDRYEGFKTYLTDLAYTEEEQE